MTVNKEEVTCGLVTAASLLPVSGRERVVEGASSVEGSEWGLRGDKDVRAIFSRQNQPHTERATHLSQWQSDEETEPQ